MPEPNTLDVSIQKKIKDLCFQGYQLYDAADYTRALRSFYQAWLALPKPQHLFVEAGWVLTAIGDGYYRNGQYQQAVEALRSALSCPKTEQSPFAHLRLGQALFDLQDPEADKQLRHAYDLGGDALFEKESHKYRLALQPIAKTSTDPFSES